MHQTVQLATAKELVSTGSVLDTVLLGQSGGYSVLFKLGGSERALATKTGLLRLFTGVDAAARVLRSIGIARYVVDASALDETGVTRRRRPDRTAALKQTHHDAAYMAFLQERAAAGRRDDVRYSHDAVNERMRKLRTERRGR